MDKVDRADWLFEEANRLEEAGRLEESIARTRELVALFPDAAVFWLFLSRRHREAGQAAEALASVDRAFELEPNNVLCYMQRGQLACHTGDYPSAVADLAQAVKIAPAAHRYVILGSAQEDNDEPEAAEVSFRAAIALEADNSEAWLNLGQLIRSSDPVEAEACLRRAIDLGEDDSVLAWRELGFVRAKAGHPEEALGHLAKAIALGDPEGWSQLYRAAVYRDLDRDDEARADYDAAIRIVPEETYPYHLFASFLIEQDEFEDAIRQLEQAYATGTDRAETCWRLAGICRQLERWSDARHWLERGRSCSQQPGDDFDFAGVLAELDGMGV